MTQEISTAQEPIAIYDLTLNIRVSWQAHSLSTIGSNGSNKLMPRRQLLADGTETDACSGNIIKHHHAVLLAEYFEEAGVPLCPACAVRDARRVAALTDRPEYPEYKDVMMSQILSRCGLCDAHGFLITAKRPSRDQIEKVSQEEVEPVQENVAESALTQEGRQRRSKHTLLDFSFALALPDHHAETAQIYTRVADTKDEGQMLMKMTTRSGEYALHVRYFSVGIGVDIDKWQVIITDEQQRLLRHKAVLQALRDSLLSPDGALIATMLPHLTGLQGALVIRHTTGRAPMYSALNHDFIERLQAIADKTCSVYPFHSIDTFNAQMNKLIAHSFPCYPASYLQKSSYSTSSTEPDMEERNRHGKRKK